ncbi:MAG TPA: glucose-6-phosphate dehydrogenase [Gaiellaceae bacterium]|jgi:glucose-6-phosphate 1-dehydrogenase|nr:glucose-6-phosphate dehydrogenase [Gaiellaceae bacterium]
MTVTTTEANPLLEGLLLRRTPDPCALVIFGASGDLTQKKLFPALYSLAFRKLLPDRFAVLGVARTEETDDAFKERMKDAVQQHGRDEFRQDVWDTLSDGMRYVATDFADEGGQDEVASTLEELDRERGLHGNRVYYLAIPPSVFPTVVRALGKRRTTKGWTRLIVEKPFGHDLQSACTLNDVIHEHFAEDEVFRIDHYLGKETVQNMLALRFANGIFEPIWNRQFIDHVQITVAESIGIEGRAGYYEQAGAIRDIFQNHLLQLLAITAMEPPIDFTAESVRNEKVKVLRAMHTPGPKSVVRGQYGRGFIEGEEVPGYREEEGVDPQSMTETYVAAKLYVDNWRWADTPFYVRMGKRLPRRETTIAIQFKRAPHPPFEETAADGLRPNVLLVHIQPDEGVSLAIGAKVPGQGMTIRTVHMDFLYGGAFRTGMPEAYERLILDCVLGDATLFTRTDEVVEQWKLVDAMVAPWLRDRPSFPNYAAGTWGPPSAEELLRRDGRSWRRH